MTHDQYNSLIMDASSSICYLSDMETYELFHLTKAGMDALGISSLAEYEGRKCYEMIHGADKPCAFCTNSKLQWDNEYRWEHYNERLGRWFDITDSIIEVEGRPCRLEIARDVSARKEESLELSSKLTTEDVLFRCLDILTHEKDFKLAIDLFLAQIGSFYLGSRVFIFEFDAEKQLMHNTFGWSREGIVDALDKMQGLPLAYIADWMDPFRTAGEYTINAPEEAYAPGSEEYELLTSIDVESLIAVPLFRDEEIVGFMGVCNPGRNSANFLLLRSASKFVLAELERRRFTQELEYMSYTDSLTGLHNRNHYIRILDEMDRHPPETLTFISVNANGMKDINEQYGQRYGDFVLRQVAKALHSHFPEHSFRVGGDEFVVLCPNLSKAEYQEKTVALHNAFDASRNCNVSIGCAWGKGDVDINNLRTQATDLMYAEKQEYYHSLLKEGRPVYVVGALSEVVREITEGRFEVFYQPQINLKTGMVVGAEALVRKKNEEGGYIPPNKFIPIYEGEGVIRYVDLFVLETACKVMRKCLDAGFSFHMAVNFSRVTLLEPNIVEQIKSTCEKWNVPTSSIVIEVTESIGTMDYEHLKNLVAAFNSEGFSVSLDDFGSQYSNLAILSSLDFAEIKFDMSLVSTLTDNTKSQVIMENGIRMCKGLHGPVALAEGIETREQLDLLLTYDCDYGQGYYFSRPVPQVEFEAFIEKFDTPHA